MSDLEFCRLAHDGKLDALKEKISSSARVEDITKKKDSVIYNFIFTKINLNQMVLFKLDRQTSTALGLRRRQKGYR
jgi:hypothetical protein